MTLAASAQLGKTILGNIFALGSVAMGRGTTLIVHPTIENAARWSRMKLAPMMRRTPCVSALFPQRPRDAANSVLYKERADGLANLLISGANSAASLSQLTAAFQLQDDLAKWEPNSAGDPEAQADSRSRAYEFAKIFKTSTPLVLPGCKITKDFEAGSQEMPFVPYPHCSHMHVLEWSNFRFDNPDNPYFVCPSCGGVIEERHRQRMLDGFEWRSRKSHRSTHAPQLLALERLLCFAKLAAHRGRMDQSARRQQRRADLLHGRARPGLSAEGRRAAAGGAGRARGRGLTTVAARCPKER